MTKDQALQIVKEGSDYFVQSYILKEGQPQISKIYGPFTASTAKKVKSMNADQREKFKKRLLITEAKNKACSDCGMIKAVSKMTFDHIKGQKQFNIANGPHKTWNKLLNEIDKCEIVCRSCHNIREYLRGVSGRLTKVEDLAELLFRMESLDIIFLGNHGQEKEKM